MTFVLFSIPLVTFAQEISVQTQAMADAKRDVAVDIDSTLWLLGGCLGNISVVIVAKIYEPTPPATRLLGKSPEYVAYYADTYKSKATEIQSSKAIAGCLTGVAISCLGYAWLVFITIEDNTYFW